MEVYVCGTSGELLDVEGNKAVVKIPVGEVIDEIIKSKKWEILDKIDDLTPIIINHAGGETVHTILENDELTRKINIKKLFKEKEDSYILTSALAGLEPKRLIKFIEHMNHNLLDSVLIRIASKPVEETKAFHDEFKKNKLKEVARMLRMKLLEKYDLNIASRFEDFRIGRGGSYRKIKNEIITMAKIVKLFKLKRIRKRLQEFVEDWEADLIRLARRRIKNGRDIDVFTELLPYMSDYAKEILSELIAKYKLEG